MNLRYSHPLVSLKAYFREIYLNVNITTLCMYSKWPFTKLLPHHAHTNLFFPQATCPANHLSLPNALIYPYNSHTLRGEMCEQCLLNCAIQPVLPQRKTQCFTTIQNKWQNSSFISLALSEVQELQSKLNSGNLVRCLLSPSLRSKILMIKIYKTTILSAVLYGCWISSLILREEYGLKVSENRVLTGISGPKKEEVAGGWTA